MAAVLSFILGRRMLLILLSIAALLFIVSLWHRYPYIDDCWFGEQAYWLSKDGIVKTASIHAGLGWEQRLFVYHKLNIWIGALIVYMAGWSLYYLKTFTLLIYLFFFYLLFRYFKLHQYQGIDKKLLLTSFLVFANPLMFIYGFTYRPEILVMTLGFSSFLMLEKARLNNSGSHILMMTAGIAAGAALLAHLNGMIFAAAGFIYLIIYRKYRYIPVFLVSFTITASFYFIELIPAGNFQLFLAQMNHWPDNIQGNYGQHNSPLAAVLSKLLNEHQRFFWSDKVAIFSGLFFFSVIVSFRYLIKEHRPIIIYTGLLILLLNLLGSQIAERYLIYYLPMMAIIIAVSILNMLETKQYKTLIFAMLLVTFQIVILTRHWHEIMLRNSDITFINQQINENIPIGHGPVMAPYSFIYNEIENRPILTYHSLEYFEAAEKRKLTGTEALKRCAELGVDYIVVDKDLENDKDKYPWFEPAIRGNDLNYSILKTVNGYLILSRKNADRSEY
jgi:hypothetical protein